MTVKECYEAIGADYEEVLRRLANEERVKRFLLKGICLNLSITRLAESSSALTESLRAGGWSEEAGPLFERVKDDYGQTVQAIQMLKND